MDLKNLPANTCPLCRQAALDQSTDHWTCDFCGCKLEFDPASRRSRITYWPPQYAALKAGMGSDWLSRRELFERVDAAVAAVPPERAPRLIGPLLVIAAALLLLCVMLGAVASAIVISPSIARTRRVISQAYLPTATATATITPATALATGGVATPALDPSALTSPLSATATSLMEATAEAPASIVSTTAPLPTPALPTPAPQLAQPQPQPPPTQQLPPTFTPVPPTQAPTAPPALPGAQTSPLPPEPGSVAVTPPQAAPTQAPTPQATLTPTPTIMIQPTVTNTQPLQPGSQLLAGTVQIITVFANGNPTLNEADEYVELRNVGQTPAYLDGWKLRAIRNADNVQLDEYTFPGGSVIAANQTCRIYTNLPFGTENCGFAGGFANDQPLWPPNGARAVLLNPQGQEMARFVY